MTFQNPTLNFEQTDGWTDKPKAICLSLGLKTICPLSFFKVGDLAMQRYKGMASKRNSPL